MPTSRLQIFGKTALTRSPSLVPPPHLVPAAVAPETLLRRLPWILPLPLPPPLTLLLHPHTRPLMPQPLLHRPSRPRAALAPMLLRRELAVIVRLDVLSTTLPSA